MRVDQYVSAVRDVEVPVFVRLRSSCIRVNLGTKKVGFVKTRDEGCLAEWRGMCGCNPPILSADEFKHSDRNRYFAKYSKIDNGL